MRLFRNMLMFCLLFLPALAFSTENNDSQLRFTIKPQLDYIIGHSLYKIGYMFTAPDGSKSYFPQYISQLKYFINNLYVGGAAGAELYKFKLDCSLKKSVFPDALKTEDSDWGYFYMKGYLNTVPSSLDIFSESDTTMDGWLFDTRLTYMVLQESVFKLSCGIGFSWSAFSFSMFNVDQYYPSYETYKSTVPSTYSGHVLVDGPVGTYTVTNTTLIYLVFTPTFTLLDNSLILSGSFIFSPYALIDDVDDHILRDKLSVGHDEGFMMRGEGSVIYRFSPFFSVELSLSYETSQASGKQTQTRYLSNSEGPAGLIGSISHATETEYLSAGIKTGFSF